MNQDFIAWVGQGTVSDRWNEHLGASDEGIIELRRRFLADIKVVEDGGDPKGILRDPSKNYRIYLPRSGRRFGVAPNQTGAQPLTFLAGQPPEILEEMKRIWAEHNEEVSMSNGQRAPVGATVRVGGD